MENFIIQPSKKIESYSIDELNNFPLEYIEELIQGQIKDQSDGNDGYFLKNTHFVNGSVHSNQYYFIKKYFQNNLSSILLGRLLSKCLIEDFNINLHESSTIIGFRQYSAFVMQKACEITNMPKLNYAIIDEKDGKYIWKKNESLNKNLIIVLPISCSFLAYSLIKEFIENFLIKVAKEKEISEFSKVNVNFVSLFGIFDEKLSDVNEITFESNSSEELHQLYSNFNWQKVTGKSTIELNFNNIISKGIALVKLYSKLYLPEKCPLCYGIPNQMPVIPTFENFETPNLIIGFENYSTVKNKEDLIKLLIDRDNSLGILEYGNVEISQSLFTNFIHGNLFYKKNKEQILNFFIEKLNEIFKEKIPQVNEIVIITSDYYFNSPFLIDLINQKLLADKKIKVLTFQPFYEHIDNFIALNKNTILPEENKVLIYFEEIVTFGNAFKILSNYTKQFEQLRRKDENVIIRHGFDYFFTFIDRTTKFTRNEIIKKLFSEKNTFPKNHFLPFFTLNVPIIDPSHLGNSFKNRNKKMKLLIDSSSLDTLKFLIQDEINSQKNIDLSEDKKPKVLTFFPFINLREKDNFEVYNTYKTFFTKENLEILKLWLAHEINDILADKFIGTKQIIEILKKKFFQDYDNYFLNDVNSKFRKKEYEEEIIEDSIIKILSRHPYTYYKVIYEDIFKLVNDLLFKVTKGEIDQFNQFRKLKFYVRRSVDLNSNIIISIEFLEFVKRLYDGNIKLLENDLEKKYEISINNIDEKTCNEAYIETSKNYNKYKLNQISEQFTYLIYCYKDLLHNNANRAIILEGLINDIKLLPDELINDENGVQIHDLKKLIKNPYFNFMSMLKSENIYIINSLITHHKTNYKGDIIYEDYFNSKSANKTISSFAKFFNNSKHKNNAVEFEIIKNSYINTLKAIEEIEKLKRREENNQLDKNIDKILNSITSIFGLENLKYNLFIKYNEHEKDNIYKISSDYEVGEAIVLNEEGLIYKMLNGLYDNPFYHCIQTFLSFAIQNNTHEPILTLKHNYFEKSKASFNTVDLSAAIEAEFLGVNNNSNYYLSNKPNMGLIFRLSAFDKEKTSLFEGKAILFISNHNETNLPNFLSFMNVEKVRLLLLLKDELLGYIQKQVDNNVFQEVIEARKVNQLQQSLRHGLGAYSKSLYNIYNYTLNHFDEKQLLNENRIVFETICNSINSQLSGKIIDEIYNSFSKKELLDKVALLFKSPYLGRFPVDIKTIAIKGFNNEEFELPESIVNIIFPELIINMKKYCVWEKNKEFSIEFINEENTFIFSNKCYSNVSIKKSIGSQSGLKMCEKILTDSKIGKLEVNVENDLFVVKLKIVKNEKNTNN